MKIMSNSLFGENILYKNASQYFFDQLSLHQQYHPVIQKIVDNFVEK